MRAMTSTTKVVLALAIALSCSVDAAGGSLGDTADESVAEYRDTLNRYCVTCHNEKIRTASLTLDLTNVSDLSEAPHIWERVITKLSLKAMPPVGMPRPDADFYARFSTYLKTNLDTLAAEEPNPGRTVTAHRLNRHESSPLSDLRYRTPW